MEIVTQLTIIVELGVLMELVKLVIMVILSKIKDVFWIQINSCQLLIVFVLYGETEYAFNAPKEHISILMESVNKSIPSVTLGILMMDSAFPAIRVTSSIMELVY